MIGRGFPDLLICHRGVLALIEVKNGRKPPSERQLTQDEMIWHARWVEAPVYILESVAAIPNLLEKILDDNRSLEL